MTSSALVLLMIPGVGYVLSKADTASCERKVDCRNSFFYSGLARRKSALSLIWLSMMSAAVVSFQWFFWGYSLTFSHTAGSYIGDLSNFGFRNVLAQPSVGSPKVPDMLFAIYQVCRESSADCSSKSD
jgi:ammonium transporter, Amt family